MCGPTCLRLQQEGPLHVCRPPTRGRGQAGAPAVAAPSPQPPAPQTRTSRAGAGTKCELRENPGLSSSYGSSGPGATGCGGGRVRQGMPALWGRVGRNAVEPPPLTPGVGVLCPLGRGQVSQQGHPRKRFPTSRGAGLIRKAWLHVLPVMFFKFISLLRERESARAPAGEGQRTPSSLGTVNTGPNTPR